MTIWRRAVALLGALVLALAIMIALPTAAQAYTTTGCKWGTGNLRINMARVTGGFSSALTQAASNYTTSTDVNLTMTTASGPSFTTENTNYGATGWEGYANWTCLFGRTTHAKARLNNYYLGSAPVARLKVVWLHELGHGLGLGHVNVVARVMYTSASTAYTSGGVRSLTADEKNGINALY